MIYEISPLGLLNTLSSEDKKSLAHTIRNKSLPKSCKKALFSKSDKTLMKGALEVTMLNRMLDILEPERINKIPNINFEMK